MGHKLKGSVVLESPRGIKKLICNSPLHKSYCRARSTKKGIHAAKEMSQIKICTTHLTSAVKSYWNLNQKKKSKEATKMEWGTATTISPQIWKPQAKKDEMSLLSPYCFLHPPRPVHLNAENKENNKRGTIPVQETAKDSRNNLLFDPKGTQQEALASKTSPKTRSWEQRLKRYIENKKQEYQEHGAYESGSSPKFHLGSTNTQCWGETNPDLVPQSATIETPRTTPSQRE